MQKYEASDLTVIANCKKHKLPQTTFYNWRHQLSNVEKPGMVWFQEIQLTPGSSVPIISIEFAQGTTIRIEGSISASFLRQPSRLVVSA